MPQSKITFKKAGELIALHTEEISSSALVDEPLVSVCFITYNHADFVEQALDGVLTQETKFPFEIIIGDDASTDGTSEIVDRYQRQHTDKIKILRSTENLGKYTGSGGINFIRSLRACRGKYIAILEGDDYWIDPHKLQKQVKILRDDPRVNLTGHLVQCVDAAGKPLNITMCEEPTTPDRFCRQHCTVGPAVHPNSWLFRSDRLRPFFDQYRSCPYGDDLLMPMIIGEGYGMRTRDRMSAYRLHDSGIWFSRSDLEKDMYRLFLYYWNLRKYPRDCRDVWEQKRIECWNRLISRSWGTSEWVSEFVAMKKFGFCSLKHAIKICQLCVIQGVKFCKQRLLHARL